MTSQIAKAELFPQAAHPLMIHSSSTTSGMQAARRRSRRPGRKPSRPAAGQWRRLRAFTMGEIFLPLDDALVVVARITRSVDIPVTVDFEGGYAADPETVSQNVRRLFGAWRYWPEF